MNNDDKAKLVALLLEKDKRSKENKIKSYFPEEGPYSRHNYPKQMAFFEAGSKHSERLFIAGNRCGKTFAGAFEMTCHLTGIYPDWWTGKRFDRGISAWAAGISNETVRDVIQAELLGKGLMIGTGMIPKHRIVGKPVMKAGVPMAIDRVYVQHISGDISELGFKAYAQESESFMGTAKDVIWLDEEPTKFNIYSECLTRIMTTRGIIYLTFTPLKGLSDVVLSFLPGGKLPEDGIVPEEYLLDLNRD